MKMSKDDAANNTSSCANCGIAEIDDIKLKECYKCDLVRYCRDQCQRDHKSEHEDVCKKRAAELRDELLFKQPESTHVGDCPICFLPMPFDLSQSVIYECCSKVICTGCDVTNAKRAEMRLKHTCPFCREPLTTEEEANKRRIKRAEANDPVAMREEGVHQYEKRNFSRSFEWYTKAAELGDAEAHFNLAGMYLNGVGVEQDKGKLLYHLEEAAIGGHPIARHDLGIYESSNGNDDGASKHYIIAASQGDDVSIKALMDGFKSGFVRKEDLAAALRAHQAAVDATKSPQREEADEFHRFQKQRESRTED